MSATITETRPLKVDTNTGNHDKFSHIVERIGNKGASQLIAEAKLYGTKVTALCGKTWVPDDSPSNYPVCPTCKELAEKFYNWAGGRS